MTPSSTIDRVRDASDILAVIGEYVRLKRVGVEYVGLCPFHNEKSPSFSVHPNKGVYFCHGCGAAGDVFTFVQHVEAVSFPEALRRLADRAGIQIEATTAALAPVDLRYAEQLAWESRQFRAWFVDVLESWRAEEPDTERSLLSWAPWLHRLRTMHANVLVGFYADVRRGVPWLPAFLRGRAEERDAISTGFLEAYWMLDAGGRAIVAEARPHGYADMQQVADTAAAILESISPA